MLVAPKPPRPKKQKPQKITKKIRTKKKKTTSNKKPPRQASPNLAESNQRGRIGADNSQNLNLGPVRKSQTMSEEAKNAMQISQPGSQQPFMMNMPQGASTLTSGGIPIPSKGQTAATQQRMLEMMGPKEILQYEIEQEKDKITKRERTQREAMETQRKMHQNAIEALQKKFEEQRKFIEQEKQRLIEDKARTIELEKQKLLSLQGIDSEARELTFSKAIEKVREVYAEQHDSLRKQLEQKVQMNKLAEEVSKSSGDINSMVHKLSAQQEGQLREREAVILQKEQNLAERRRIFQEKKVQLEQRKRKIQNEQAELALRQQETTHEYEKEKREIFADLDDKESEASALNREIRNRTIDLEIEIKRTVTDEERVRNMMAKEKQESIEKTEEHAIEIKQIDVARRDFRKEMNQTEAELRKKLDQTENLSRDLGVKEHAFKQQQTEFEEEHSQVMHLNNQLQEQIERFNMKKEEFERRAQAVKEQGENDQLDSEKIGFFKANKERIKDEMKKLRGALDEEKDQIAEDRVKLEIFKNELRTKQKAIETMRYEYIKATSQENMMHFADQAKDLAMYNLTKDSNTDVTKTNATKDLYPMGSLGGSGGKPAPPVTNTALLTMASRQSTFNFNDYMKRLDDKLSIVAPSTKKMVGTGFQEFLLKERQQYLTSVATYEHENSLLGSSSAGANQAGATNHQAF